MKPELPRHGGDLAFATARYGKPSSGWLDLSTGINPQPYPLPDFPLEAFTRLPQPVDLLELEAVARTFYGVPPRVGLAAVPGSESAIRLLPSVLQQGEVAIASPTYRTHADAWAAAGRRLVGLPPNLALPAASGIAVIVNPNNPDGRILDLAQLRDLGRSLADRGGTLIVDEAYAEIGSGQSAASLAADLPVMVLRSFGKFFGLPGLRLGFVIGPPALLTPLRQLLGDWPVSGPAIVTGRAALHDHDWIEASRQRIANDLERLLGLLEAAGLRVAGSAGLFVLVDDPRAQPLHEALAQRGIWTRIFPERSSWLRLGLPPAGQFDRLQQALTAIGR